MGTFVSLMLILGYTPRLAAANLQHLTGHVPAVLTHLSPTGLVPGTNYLRLAIGLPLRNQVELTNLLAQIYDRRSTNYHHYLTPAQFAGRFGPSPGDYQSLMTFARANGLTVAGTNSNRLLLDVGGQVSQIERALHVNLRFYPHPSEKRAFFAPDAEPALALSVPILHISGLDNYILPHPMNLRKEPSKISSLGRPWAGSGPKGSYMGADFRKAYVPGTVMTGLGQRVGLFQNQSGFYPSDIIRYENLAGLPNVPVNPVLVDSYDGSAGQANDECSLDIEMAISMAPGLSQVLVYEGVLADDILNQMATDDLAQQLSSSWAFLVDPNTEAIFQQFASQGQSFFNASGDNGTWVGGVAPPSDDPNLTSVGGTTLTTAPNGAWASEKVWDWNSTNSSGGGISTQYAIPAWQQGIDMTLNQGSTTLRNIPDVALTADNVYVLYGDGTNDTYGGTSCAAPLWAGFTALINQQAADNSVSPVGFVNPAIYALCEGADYTNLFHDILAGNNTNAASDNLFFATPGYDLCTGWGTPAGQSLIDALVGPASPTPAYIITQPTNETTIIGATATFSVLPGGLPPFSYQWTFNGANLAGATNETLTLDNVQLSEAGDYQVQVTNAFGSALSSTAVLTVDQQLSGCAPVPTGLVSWWAAEGNADDTMGLNNGTAVGSLGYASGEVGQAFVFDDSTSYIILPASPSLDIGASGTGFTIECWIAPNDFNVNVSGAPIIEWDSDSTDGLQFWCGGSLFGNIKDLSGNDHRIVSANGVLSVNVWQHVALTYDEISGNAFIYLNGNIVASQNFGSFVPQTTFPANIGRRTGQQTGLGDTYGGMMDELSIYNRALSSNEIQAIYMAGSGGKCFTSPVILTQPVNQTTNVGGSVAFSIVADGTVAMNYQWSFNGTNLVGATNETLTLDNVQSSEAGDYAVLVTNPFGSVLSSNAVLTVVQRLPDCSAVPVGLVSWWAAEGNANDNMGVNNGTVIGSLGYASGEVGQGFVFDGSTSYITVPASPGLDIGATGTGITIECWLNPSDFDVNFYGAPIVEWDSNTTDGLQFWSGGNLSGNIKDSSNNPHTINSPSGVLTVNTWQHVAMTYDKASGNAVIYLNGNAIESQYLGSFTPETSFPMNIGSRTAPITGRGDIYNGEMDELCIYNRALGQDEIQAIYMAGNNGKCPLPPTILFQPTNQTASVGSVTGFGVTTSGSQPLDYQWTFQGTNLIGATNMVLTLTNVQLNETGNYGVMVTNALGSALSSNALLTVFGVPPLIASQPTNKTVVVGNIAVFGVTASGSPVFNYQWKFQGTNLTGATNASLSLTNVQFSQAGNYSVQVTNAFGSVLSSNAVLTVIGLPPAIVTQPTNLIALVGTSPSFVVTATGTSPLAYHWIFNATNYLVGATNATLTLANAQAAQAGAYSVVITNSWGQATSSVASLSFYAPPVITSQPTNLNLKVSSTATFAVVATGSAPLGYQWYWNTTNSPIVKATNANLTIANVQPTNAGAYEVLVTNLAGSALSSNALLVIHLQNHFAWSLIPSPRFVKTPFTATIQAQNVSNSIVTNFTGTVSLSSTLGVPVQPSVSGAFVKGSWTGSVMIAQAATNLVLQASDGLGDTGLANAVSILNQPVLMAERYGDVLLVYWPTNIGGFVVETAPQLNSSNWVPIVDPPLPFGNENLEAFPITTTNGFYRLLYTLP